MRYLLRRSVFQIIFLSSLILLGCSTTKPTINVEYVRSRLIEPPSHGIEYAYDYDLFSRATLMSADELVALYDDVLNALDSVGVQPIASFLIHYIERLYFAQPPGWEGAVKRLLAKAKAKSTDWDEHEQRTVGFIDYNPPVKTKIYTLKAATLFFHFADTDFGRSYLTSGYGAHKMIERLLILGQYCEQLNRVASGDKFGAKIKVLLDELNSTYDICGQTSSGGGHNEPSGLSVGLQDAIVSCIQQENQQGLAYAQRHVEAAMRCMKAKMEQVPHPQAASVASAKAKVATAKAAEETAYKYNECVKAGVFDCDGDGVMDSEQVNYESMKEKAAIDLAYAEVATAKAEYQLAVEEYKEEEDYGWWPWDNKDTAERAGKARKKAKAWGASLTKLRGVLKIRPVAPGYLPKECIRPENADLFEKWKDLYDPFAPGPDPLISYFIETPMDMSFLRGCGPQLFAMGEDLTTCMNGLVTPCATVAPPPDDYCDCVEKYLSQLEGVAVIGEFLTLQSACNNVSCEEGYECIDGDCRPIVMAPCGDADIPHGGTGPTPDPATATIGIGMPFGLPGSHDECGPFGLKAISHEELLGLLAADGIDMSERLRTIRRLRHERFNIHPAIDDTSPP